MGLGELVVEADGLFRGPARFRGGFGRRFGVRGGAEQRVAVLEPGVRQRVRLIVRNRFFE